MPCGDQRIAHTKYFPSLIKASYFHNHITLYDHINNTCDHDMITMNPPREKDNEQSKSVSDWWAMAMVHKDFI